MANEINSNSPTHDQMRYEVRDPQGGLVGEAAHATEAKLLHEIAKDVYGDGSTVTRK